MRAWVLRFSQRPSFSKYSSARFSAIFLECRNSPLESLKYQMFFQIDQS
jgi:hypothetical protein